MADTMSREDAGQEGLEARIVTVEREIADMVRRFGERPMDMGAGLMLASLKNHRDDLYEQLATAPSTEAQS